MVMFILEDALFNPLIIILLIKASRFNFTSISFCIKKNIFTFFGFNGSFSFHDLMCINTAIWLTNY